MSKIIIRDDNKSWTTEVNLEPIDLEAAIGLIGVLNGVILEIVSAFKVKNTTGLNSTTFKVGALNKNK